MRTVAERQLVAMAIDVVEPDFSDTRPVCVADIATSTTEAEQQEDAVATNTARYVAHLSVFKIA